MIISSKKFAYICAFSLVAFGLMSSTAYSGSGSATTSATAKPTNPLQSVANIAVVDKLTFQFPNGIIAITKPNEAPYCAAQGKCDFSVDCYSNEPAPKLHFMWACENAPGACVGKCYQQPITSKQDALQKFLTTTATGDSSK